MKNRKVKNASYSQQRTDRLDKHPQQHAQMTFASSGAIQVPQAYHHSQMSQNMTSYSNQMAAGLGQLDNSEAIRGSQPVLASTGPVNTQNSAHQQHQQYNSTQPAPNNHAATAF